MPLTSVLTKSFAWRCYNVLEELGEGSLGGLTKHRALAWVLNDMTHGPYDHSELEWMGNHAAAMARAHQKRKIGPAEQALKRNCSEATMAAKVAALADLRRELYTMPLQTAIPLRQPPRSEVESIIAALACASCPHSLMTRICGG